MQVQLPGLSQRGDGLFGNNNPCETVRRAKPVTVSNPPRVQQPPLIYKRILIGIPQAACQAPPLDGAVVQRLALCEVNNKS